MKSFKQYLLEYYSKPLSELVRHLTVGRLPDGEYNLYLGKEYSDYRKSNYGEGEDGEWLFLTFLMENGFNWVEVLDGDDLERYRELESKVDSGDIDDDEMEEFEEITSSKENEYLDAMAERKFEDVPDLLIKEYGSWLENVALSRDDVRNWSRSKDMYVNLVDYPPCYFMSYEDMLKNDWLIHFSDSARSIAKEGFLYGVPVEDMKGLALSTWKMLEDKDLMERDGYVFSYSLDRFSHTNMFTVGTNFVIFQGSGILIYHNGDDEYQAICLKDSVRNFIPVLWDERQYVIRDKDSGKVYWKSGVDDIDLGVIMEKLNDWIRNNIRQYGKRIITRVK